MVRLRIVALGACLVFLLAACGGDVGFDSGNPNPEQPGAGDSSSSSGATSSSSSSGSGSSGSSSSGATASGSSGAGDDSAQDGQGDSKPSFCSSPKPQSLSSAFTSAVAGGNACSTCHGVTGNGSIGPGLTRRDYSNFTFEAFEQAVRVGMAATGMPAYSAGQYPDQALRNDYEYFAHDTACTDGPVAVDPNPPTGPVSNSHLRTTNFQGSSCRAQNALQRPQLWRLTSRQFANSVRSVFGAHNFPNNFAWPDLGDAPTIIGMSARADRLLINSVNMDYINDAVELVVDRLLDHHSGIRACASATQPGCIDDLVDEYGPLLWRRPLNSQERDELLASLATVRHNQVSRDDQIGFVLSSLMLSHNFLFRYELGSQSGTNVDLSPYEVASWLSYSLWASPPDAQLYQAAAGNQLRTQQQIDAQVNRMMVDNRFRDNLVDFFVDFLKLDMVLTVDKLSSLNFSGNQRSALLQSARMTLRDRVSNLDADIMDVFRGNDFYVNNTIRSFFGLTGNFGSGMTLTSVSNEERYGIMSHPAFLAVHSNTGGSGIVRRGVFVLEQLLCAHLGDPPPDIGGQPLPSEVTPAQTSTRDLLFLEHSSQQNCIACHRIIDPAGYGFESYDTLGRFRTHEKIGISGGLPGGVPIDASGTLGSPALYHEIIFDNHIDYIQRLIETPEMRACLTRRMVEAMVGRPVGNSCDLEKVSHQVDYGNATIRELVLGVMHLESGRARTR